MHFRLWTSLMVVSALFSPAALAAAAQEVGVNSAVNTDAKGTAPGAATRPLAIGQQVVHNEHIVTDAGGQVQILFLDESAMTIGPNSDLTIDEFVYDPKTGTGRLAMNATRGVMRFVGGKLSKNENAVSMQTPAATIGIRGGIFVMNLQRGGSLDTVFVYGKGMTVTGTGGISQLITRPGFGVSVAGPGAAPTLPAAAPSGQLGAMFAQLGGKNGATGGSKNPPSDRTVASSGISTTISGNVAASVQQAGVSQPTTQPPAVNVGTIQSDTQQNTVASQSSPAVSQQGALGAVQYTDGFVLLLGSNNSNAQEGFIGTLINGRLVVPPQASLQQGGTIPLPVGQGTFGPIFINSSDSSATVGTTFLTNDRTAFTAVTNDAGGGFGTPNGNTTFIVGGVPTVTLPTTGVGSYTGVATGIVQNGTIFSPATGGFSASYNFAAQQGSAAFSNFGGKSFSGPILGASGNIYVGSLAGQGTSGVVEGKFFGTGASTTGGIFAATGQNYTAAGVYAGQR
jgi:FecR protein